MRVILEKIAEFAYQYGKDGAGMPSYRGNCEISVPKELMDGKKDEK